jgi:glyoxylase-like metal-dependent hydrolase (beta-lactamase superfamily II)
LEAIYTPGHISDHMSFLLTHSEAAETILFSGDIILGSPSTAVENLSDYMETLRKLKDTPAYHFDHICVPHSVALDPEDSSSVMMEGQKKLNEYIKYRVDRLTQLEKLAETQCAESQNGLVSRDELYEGLYGDRALQGPIRQVAYNNLDL